MAKKTKGAGRNLEEIRNSLQGERRGKEVSAAADGKTGPRRVPLCYPCFRLIERLRDEQADRPMPSPWLLGRRRTRHNLKHSLVRARKRAGMPRVAFNLLRHTRASWWVQAGVPLAKVAMWMGHSVEICTRYYAGLQTGYDPDCERLPG